MAIGTADRRAGAKLGADSYASLAGDTNVRRGAGSIIAIISARTASGSGDA